MGGSAELISLTVFVIMLVILVSASINDWRDREVSNIHWAIFGVVGSVGFTITCITSNYFRYEYVCLFVATIMIIYDILIDHDKYMLPFYIVMAVFFVIGLYGLYDSGDPYFVAWASVLVSYILFVGMYLFGLIQGGADVKCLICMSISFPLYPSFLIFPYFIFPMGITGELFTFAISVLFFGAIIVMFVTIYYAVYNLKTGTKGRGMVTGKIMDISEARKAHVWPTQDVVDGEIVRSGIPENTDEVYDRLEKAGETQVWVTPMIPFIIPMTVAAVFVALFGNPLFIL